MSSLHPILIKIWCNLGKPFKTDSLHEANEVKKTRMDGRNKTLLLTSVLLLMLSVVVGGVYMASAETDQDDAPGSNPPKFINSWRRGPFVGCLDERQRQELMETLSEMREDGATFDEIREYVQAYLGELGVECPRPELTDDQIEALQQLRGEIHEIREGGATPEEIREYLTQKAEELGVELPLKHHVKGFRGFGGAPDRGSLRRQES